MHKRCVRRRFRDGLQRRGRSMQHRRLQRIDGRVRTATSDRWNDLRRQSVLHNGRIVFDRCLRRRHGGFLAAERWLAKRFGGGAFWRRWGPRVLLALITYFLVNITWVFFRAQDFETAWRMLITMLTFVTDGEKVLPTVFILQVTITIAVMLAVHWGMRNRPIEEVVARRPFWLVGLLWGSMLTLIIITQGENDAFIYFQF